MHFSVYPIIFQITLKRPACRAVKYKLLGYPEDVDNRIQEVVAHYAAGLYAYRRRDRGRAILSFLAVPKVSPDDGPIRTMLGCGEFKKNLPGNDRDGCFTMKSK